jgi:Protein of unknown function (DUF664).
MAPEHTLRYLKSGLEAAPLLLEHLLAGVTEAEIDFRPDPDRFTLREVVAHLADWEPIWLGRMEVMVQQEDPHLPGYDEGQFALDHDYAHAELAGQLATFREARARTVAFLSALPRAEWTGRTGRHDEWGRVTIYDLAALVCGHDGYHLRQIVEWRAAFAAANPGGAL